MNLEIRVPASSANLGPGFDSLGMALPLFLTIHAEVASDWEIHNQTKNLPEVLAAKDHLIVRTALWTAQKYRVTLPACILTLSSDIPLARGLGSSAAAIVGGIQLASEVAHLNLSREEIVQLASELEGHPDNVAAAIYGGIVVALDVEDQTDVLQLPPADLHWLVAIPRQELKTSVARGVLPETYTAQAAIQSSGVANMIVAALAAGDAERIGYYMERDLFHEPYRRSLIEHAEAYRQDIQSWGAFGTAISGAGPTLISIVPEAFPVEQFSSLYPHLRLARMKTCQLGLAVKQIV